MTNNTNERIELEKQMLLDLMANVEQQMAQAIERVKEIAVQAERELARPYTEGRTMPVTPASKVRELHKAFAWGLANATSSLITAGRYAEEYERSKAAMQAKYNS